MTGRYASLWLTVAIVVGFALWSLTMFYRIIVDPIVPPGIGTVTPTVRVVVVGTVSPVPTRAPLVEVTATTREPLTEGTLLPTATSTPVPTETAVPTVTSTRVPASPVQKG